MDLWRDQRLPERFWSKVRVDAASECWEWTAALTNGYGAFSIKSRRVRAHRHAYIALMGPVADHLELDHLCRNRACVNPAHLEPVTRRVNQLRGETFAAAQVARTRCPQGHEYDVANTRVRNGHRYCRTCQREWNRERYFAAMEDPARADHVRALARERTRRYRARKAAA